MLTFRLLNHLSFHNFAKVHELSMHTVHRQAAMMDLKNNRKECLLLRVGGERNGDC